MKPISKGNEEVEREAEEIQRQVDQRFDLARTITGILSNLLRRFLQGLLNLT